MNFSNITAGIPDAFWWLFIPIVTVSWISKSRWVKGRIGELCVQIIAWFALDGDTYRRLHNVMLRTPGGATQIDHIFVSRFGVFVLETKNMQGWIFGNENQAKWTQSIFGKNFKFQNPLRQNFKHTKAVEEILQIPPDAIHSVVVFTGTSTFKTKMPKNVTSGLRFPSYIKSFQRQVFTENEATSLLKELETKSLKSGHILSLMHVHNLRQRSKTKVPRYCPKCGNSLVLRKAKRGASAGNQFWGCSGFPKCRFIRNVT